MPEHAPHPRQKRATRLGREHAVGEGHDENTAGLEHPVDLLKSLNRTGEILNRNGDHHSVEEPLTKGQFRIPVQVVNHVVVQVRVVGHLGGVHSQTDQAPFGVARRPVGPPAAH